MASITCDRAVILAGGMGTRLRPYTVVLPKPLMPIGDYPILEVIIRQLASQGFRHITMAVNHQASLIEAFFGNGSKWGLRIDYSLEQQPLGLRGGLVTLGVGGLDRGGELGGAGEQGLLLLALRPGDALAELLLLGAQLVEAGTGRPAPLVGGEESVDDADVLTTGALRGAHSVRILTKQAKVNHAPRLSKSATGFFVPFVGSWRERGRRGRGAGIHRSGGCPQGYPQRCPQGSVAACG